MPAAHKKARENLPATARRCRRLGRKRFIANTKNANTAKDTTQYTTYGNCSMLGRPERFTSVIWFSLC
jgi:hypothetical protein